VFRPCAGLYHAIPILPLFRNARFLARCGPFLLAARFPAVDSRPPRAGASTRALWPPSYGGRGLGDRVAPPGVGGDGVGGCPPRPLGRGIGGWAEGACRTRPCESRPGGPDIDGAPAERGADGLCPFRRPTGAKEWGRGDGHRRSSTAARARSETGTTYPHDWGSRGLRECRATAGMRRTLQGVSPPVGVPPPPEASAKGGKGKEGGRRGEEKH